MQKKALAAIFAVFIGGPAGAASLFEEFFASSGKSLPLPVSELQRALAHAENQNPLVHDFLFVHSGRSVQRANTDLCHPRLITAVETPRGTTFLGYAEKSQSLEVISWDESRERYEFFVVKNYMPGARPELVKAERSFCTSCHQNGGPILSRAPWREINNPSQMKLFFDQCLHERKLDPLAGAYKEYQGVRILEPFDASRSDRLADGGTSCAIPALNPACMIDSIVRANERLLQHNHACRSLCPRGDSVCVEELKRLANPGSALEPLNDIDRAILKRLADTALPTSILPDRDPNIEQPHAFLLHSRNPADLNLDVFDGDSGDFLETGPDAKWAEPQQPRVKALEFSGYDFMTLSNRAAIDQARALTGLVKSCLKKNPSGVWPESEDETIAAVAQPSDRTAPALFQHYCGTCHGPSSERRLPLEDLARLRQVRSATGDSPLDLLRSRAMPPTAPAVPVLSDSEREALIDLLKGGAS